MKLLCMRVEQDVVVLLDKIFIEKSSLFTSIHRVKLGLEASPALNLCLRYGRKRIVASLYWMPKFWRLLCEYAGFKAFDGCSLCNTFHDPCLGPLRLCAEQCTDCGVVEIASVMLGEYCKN